MSSIVRARSRSSKVTTVQPADRRRRFHVATRPRWSRVAIVGHELDHEAGWVTQDEWSFPEPLGALLRIESGAVGTGPPVRERAAGTEKVVATICPAPWTPGSTPHPAYGNVVQIVPGAPRSVP